MTGEASEMLYTRLAELLEQATGQVIQSSRHWRIETVLKPVMGRNSIPDLSVLSALLTSGAEKQLETECVDALLNNETSFFRDQPNFALLTGPVLDHVRACNAARKHIRIWCNACSTGQEPYSIAMSIADNAEKWDGWRVEIIATDVSLAIVQKARSGLYSQFEIQRGLPVMLMLRHFDQIGTDWQLKDAVRNRVSFRQSNALAPNLTLGRFDIILCRNMLMYLCENNRRQVFDNLANASHAQTLLMLGAAETVIGQTERFESSREFRGFYVRQGGESAAARAGIRRMS